MTIPTKIKDINYYMSLNYSVLLQYEDDAWFAYIPELPGCMTHGDTRDAALKLLEDAKQTWIEDCLEDNSPVPEPEYVE